MIVVSDTTPLNYLILIDSVHVLTALFGRVYAPSAVIRELAHPRSPEPVRRWTDLLPVWLTVQEPTATSLTPVHPIGGSQISPVSSSHQSAATAETPSTQYIAVPAYRAPSWKAAPAYPAFSLTA